MGKTINFLLLVAIAFQFGCGHKEKQAVIQKVLKENRKTHFACYPKNQKLGEGGDIVVSLFIDYWGKVNQDTVTIKSTTLNDPIVEKCFMDALKTYNWQGAGEPNGKTNLLITFDVKADI